MEPVTNHIIEEHRRASAWAILVGIVVIAAGAFVVAAPLTGALAATVVFGAAATVSGVFELGYARRTRRDRGALWRLIVGLVEVAVGFWVLMNPALAMTTLSLLLTAMILTRGVMQLVLAYEVRFAHVWRWYLVDGLINLLAGALIAAAWPVRSVLYLGLWVGIGLIIGGVQRLIVAITLRRALPPRERKAPPLKPAPA